MGSTSNPRTWIPYANTKDCSQGFCSPHCPQWCYIIFPPPPPVDVPDDDSEPNFSPLVIAIVGILASAFILVSYYAIISKYCRNRDSTRGMQSHVAGLELEENQEPSVQGYWHNASSNGLDESLIKSITMFKYKKEDGLIEVTDCSVCLSEFQEDESLRLLPKCTHAFHVTCIDTWLKSHPNCPLCRANVVFINGPARESPPPALESSPGDEAFAETHPGDIEMGVGQRGAVPNDADTNPVRVHSDEQNLENCNTTLIHTRAATDQQVRRSVSMDHPCCGHLLVADILWNSDDDEDDQTEERRFQGDAGPSKGQAAAEISRSSNRNNVLHCGTRPVDMKRSFSSGRSIFLNRGRGRNTIIPL